MKDFKKKISLYMVLIMVFGLLAPFAVPVRVQAVVQNLRFSANFDSMLVTRPGDPNPLAVHLPGAMRVPEGNVFIEWDILPGPTHYVLRFFDRFGQKHELTVLNLAGAQRMVSLNIYRGIDAAGNDSHRHFGGSGLPVSAFRNVNDPHTTSDAPGAFSIWCDSVDNFVPVVQFFRDGLNRVVDPPPGSGIPPSEVRRVNNRARFNLDPAAPSPVPGIGITPILPDYPLGVRNDDPDLFDTTAPPFYIPYPEGIEHFVRLSPSFNVSPGEGYSFRFNHMYFHFLWTEGNRFMFYIEEMDQGQNGLSPGSIHSFDLEVFSTTTGVMSQYFTHNVAARAALFALPSGQTMRYFLPYQLNNAWVGSERAYVFPRFDDNVAVFPYAQNIVASPPPTGVAAGSPVDHTRLEHWREEAGNLSGVPGVNFPVFDDRDLLMPDHFLADYFPYPESTALTPAKSSNGFDIRFNLPVLFNEITGTFDVQMHTYADQNPNFPIKNALVTIGHNGIHDTESFAVEVSLRDVVNHRYGAADAIPGTGGNYWRDMRNVVPTQTAQSNPDSPHRFIPNMAANNTDMILHDVSLLQRVSTIIAPAPYPDRVRIKVGNLQPSVLHIFASITLVPAHGVTQPPLRPGFEANATAIASPDNPIATFLDFNIFPVGAQMFVHVVPYNMRMDETLWRRGSYRMNMFHPLSTITHQSTGGAYVLFPISPMTRFEIVHSAMDLIEVSSPTDLVSSQIVIWEPPPIPTIGLPTNFRISHDLLRPQFPPRIDQFGLAGPSEDERANLPQWGRWVGDLGFTLQWDIGRVEDIHILLDEAHYPVGGIPYPHITVEYVVNLSPSPDTNDSAFRDYLVVQATIVRLPPAPAAPVGTRGELYIAYVGMLPPLHPSYTPFPDPIIGSRLDNGLLATGRPLGVTPVAPTVDPPIDPLTITDNWFRLESRFSPQTQTTNLFASIIVDTDAVHLYRPVSPPPPWVRADFRFPNVYFMNVHLGTWRYYYYAAGELQTGGVIAAGRGIPSMFDYIVLNDMVEMDPPPPVNLRVAACEDPEAPPALTVHYNIPLDALRAYLNSTYTISPLITINLYVTQFEQAMMDAFFSGGNSIPGRYRITQNARINAQEVQFDWEQIHNPQLLPFALGVVDMSIPEIQDTLRGENATAAFNTGTVRISNIPLLSESGEPINLLNLYPFVPDEMPVGQDQNDLLDGTNNTMNVVSPNVTMPPINLAQSINLTNLDENRRYFVFADLVVHRFVSHSALSYDGNPAYLAPHGQRDEYSILSTIAAGTTIGTPQEPDPGLVRPPAPENLRAEDRGQTSATILWDPIFPDVGDEDYVRIEWEFMRILDQTRLTDEQMQSRCPMFIPFFTEEVESAEKFAWITSTVNDERIVYFIGADGEVIDEIEVDEDGDYRFFFDFEGDEDIIFRDMTLLPNRLYFYYVRTVRIVMVDDPQLGPIQARSVSNWVELPVTTFPVTPPTDLRVEDGEVLRPGIDLQTQVLVSWQHDDMRHILGLDTDWEPTNDVYGVYFEFEYRLRVSEEAWMEITTVSHLQMIPSNLDPDNRNRVRYLISGLDPGTVYQMQVRLRDIENDDHSIWSNTITFVTGFPQDLHDLERDIDDWMQFIRRRLEEMLRQPFWFSQDTPTSSIMVFRPDDVFRGLMQGAPGNIPLYNTDADNIVFYLPATIIAEANENLRGFYTSYSDLDILLAPLLLNANHNQAVIDMLRALNARGSVLTDYFVRLEIQRASVPELFGVPALTRQTTVGVSLVATNQNIRSITTWERNVLSRATNIVNNQMADPVLRQNIRNLLMADTQPEEMLDFVDHVERQVSRQITQMVAGDMHARADGILSPTNIPVTEFDSAMHVVVTNVQNDTSVNAFRHQVNQWVPQTALEVHNGRSVTSRTPGSFFFTGRRVVIPEIEDVPRGHAVTSIVARFGLEDLFGLYVDLQRNATRQMIVGSVARIAGAPHGANPMTWAAANLNVQMSSRNATGLISRQEAIAHVMAVYEIRTGTRINTIRINNHQNTAGMQLDNRYAQAVRAAFEVGIVTDTNMNPGGHITIGEFLNILAELAARVPF